MVSNAAVNSLLHSQDPGLIVHRGFDKVAAQVPIFNFDLENSGIELDEDRSGLKSLDEVLREPTLLGREREIIIPMKSISNKTRRVILTH